MINSQSPTPPGPPREEALFRAAVELPPGVARGAFLDQACAGDSALRTRLEELLAAHEQPDDLLAFAAPAAKATIELDLADVRLWRAPSWAEINAAEAKEQAESKQP